MTNTIHPSAIVSDQAKLGAGNHIGPFAIIEDDVELGSNNVLHAGAVLRNGARLGDNNRLHENAVLAGEPQDLGFDPELRSFAALGNGNVLRENVTVHRGSKENNTTELGDNNYLMVQVHIGHDCQVGNHVIMAPNAAIGGFVEVDDLAFVSGGVMVHQFARVGRFAMLGGNAKIVQDAPPFMITDGVPGEVRGLNLVGLKRAGLAREELRQMKQAFRILFRSGAGLEESIRQLREIDSEHVAHLADFVSESPRGFHRARSQ